MRLRARRRRLPPGFLDSVAAVADPPVAMLSGWMLAERGYGRVELRADDGPPARARPFCLPRADIGATFDEPSAPMAGWEGSVDLSGPSAGDRVRLTATAVGPTGERLLGAVETTVGEPIERPSADPAWAAELGSRVRGAAPHRPGGGMRLLVFTHRLDLGGAQLYLLELLRGLLADEAIRCTVLAPRDGELRVELERLGAEVHLTGPLRADADSYECHLRELALLAREAGSDVVLANTTNAFTGIDLAERLGVPAVWAIHESVTPDQLPHEGFLVDDHVAARFRGALDSADRILFAADATRKLYAPGVADPTRLVRMDCGIPLADIDRHMARADRERLRAEHGLAPEDRVILWPGTIQPRKAQVALALAFGRLAPSFPDAVLMMTGDNRSAYAGGLREVVSRLGLPPDRVRIDPMIRSVYDRYAMADAVVVPSDNESMPFVVLEAMAFGVPVLASSIFGVPEMIEEGVTGLLCEPGCLDSLTEGLTRLLTLDPSSLARIAAAARRRVRPDRDSARYAVAIRLLLDELIGAAAAETSAEATSA